MGRTGHGSLLEADHCSHGLNMIYYNILTALRFANNFLLFSCSGASEAPSPDGLQDWRSRDCCQDHCKASARCAYKVLWLDHDAKLFLKSVVSHISLILFNCYTFCADDQKPK